MSNNTAFAVEKYHTDFEHLWTKTRWFSSSQKKKRTALEGRELVDAKRDDIKLYTICFFRHTYNHGTSAGVGGLSHWSAMETFCGTRCPCSASLAKSPGETKPERTDWKGRKPSLWGKGIPMYYFDPWALSTYMCFTRGLSNSHWFPMCRANQLLKKMQFCNLNWKKIPDHQNISKPLTKFMVVISKSQAAAATEPAMTWKSCQTLVQRSPTMATFPRGNFWYLNHWRFPSMY